VAISEWVRNGDLFSLTPEQLKTRTKRFALDRIALVSKVPRTLVAEISPGRLVRCATSVGANYRAACRGRSRAEFAAKISIVLEEADETLYRLEILHDSGVATEKSVLGVVKEAGELIAIFAANHKTAQTVRGSQVPRDA
jgi:four helix bundle protein